MQKEWRQEKRREQLSKRWGGKRGAGAGRAGDGQGAGAGGRAEGVRAPEGALSSEADYPRPLPGRETLSRALPLTRPQFTDPQYGGNDASQA